MQVSVNGYEQLLNRTAREVKSPGDYFNDYFPDWLQEVIVRIERTVACMYCLRTTEAELSSGTKEVSLPGLIIGQDHPFQLSVKTRSDGFPCEIPRVSPRSAAPGTLESYDATEYGVPVCFHLITKDGHPGAALYPPCDSEPQKLYARGYFHTTFPSEWERATTHWLIDHWPSLLISGIAVKFYDHFKQHDDRQLAETRFQFELRGDPDQGLGGLALQQKLAREDETGMMRMRVSPDVDSFGSIRPAFDTYGNEYTAGPEVYYG